MWSSDKLDWAQQPVSEQNFMIEEIKNDAQMPQGNIEQAHIKIQDKLSQIFSNNEIMGTGGYSDLLFDQVVRKDLESVSQ